MRSPNPSQAGPSGADPGSDVKGWQGLLNLDVEPVSIGLDSQPDLILPIPRAVLDRVRHDLAEHQLDIIESTS